MATLRTMTSATTVPRTSSFRPATQSRGLRAPMVVRCQAAPSMMAMAPPAVAPPAPVPVALPSSGQVLNLGAADVDHLVAVAGQLAIVSVSTTWCGPCKVMGPELDKMAAELGASALIMKLDCTTEQANRKWAMTQGVKALPTFILFKNGRRVSDMTGAKANALRRLIEAHM